MSQETKISTKHTAVVEAYLANGYRREDAVVTAGYSKKRARQTASDIFKRPEVKAYLSERMKEMQMTTEEAILRLKGHASSDMRDFIGLSMDEIKQHPNAWLIKELSYDVAWPKPEKKKPTSVANGEDAKTTPEAEDAKITPEAIVYVDKIKLYDAQAALIQILKQHQLANGQPTEIMNVPQLAELSELLAAAGKDFASVVSRMVERLKAEAAQP